MSVQVIDTLKPKNGLDFPVVEAVDVAVEGYSSLADAVTHFATDTAIAALTATLATKANASDLAITNTVVESKADKTTTDSLQSQIDQIVISASSESVVAPEVAAARVGADGTSYQTLKQRLDSDVKDLNDMMSAEEVGFTSGYYITTSNETTDYEPTSSTTGYAYAIADCTENDVIYINGEGGNSPRLWAFVDIDDTIISRAEENASTDGNAIKVVAPKNTVKVICNTKATRSQLKIIHGGIDKGYNHNYNLAAIRNPNNQALVFATIPHVDAGMTVALLCEDTDIGFSLSSDGAAIKSFGRDLYSFTKSYDDVRITARHSNLANLSDSEVLGIRFAVNLSDVPSLRKKIELLKNADSELDDKIEQLKDRTETIAATKHPTNPLLCSNRLEYIAAGTSITLATGEVSINCTLYGDGQAVEVFSSGTIITSGNYDRVTLSAAKQDGTYFTDAEVAQISYTLTYPSDYTLIDKAVRLAQEESAITFRENDTTGIIGDSLVLANPRYRSETFYKSIMMNIATKSYSVANIKLIIDSMYASGLKYLEFMLTGNKIAFCPVTSVMANGTEYDLTDNIAYGGGGYLSESDMKEIISYAKSKNVEIVASVESPSHMLALLYNHPDFQYHSSEYPSWDYNKRSIDFNNPKAVGYAMAVIDAYAKWFSEQGCKFFSVAADEFYTAESLRGYVDLYEDGILGYAPFINEAIHIVSKYRLVPWAWSDAFMVENDEIPLMSKCTILSIWSYQTGWATPAQLQAGGYKIINSNEDWYFLYASENNPTVADILAIDVHKFKDGSTISDISGAKLCFWSGDADNGDMGDGKISDMCDLVEAFGTVLANE